jgi:hypothetical protein
MKTFLLCSLFFACSLWGIENYVVPLPQVKCIKIYDQGQNNQAQNAFRFYNGCGINLFIDVCVRADDGGYKHYSSGRKVPANGNYTIYTFPFVKADEIVWTASPSISRTPPPCQ